MSKLTKVLISNRKPCTHTKHTEDSHVLAMFSEHAPVQTHMYTHTHIHTHSNSIHTHAHICINIQHTYTPTHTCMHVCTHIHRHTYTHTHTHTIHTHAHICIKIQHTCTHTHVCMHACSHTHAHTHIHTHMPVPANAMHNSLSTCMQNMHAPKTHTHIISNTYKMHMTVHKIQERNFNLVNRFINVWMVCSVKVTPI